MKEHNEKPNRIAELRRKHGMSQEKLAEKLNVTQASISVYENSINIPVDILIEISRCFDVTLEYLLNISDDKYDTFVKSVSPTENIILEFYRSLSLKHQQIVREVIYMIKQ